jgi:hypothetical protein
MYKTYREIATHIANAIPELQWIDRDKGQLDKPEEFHTILTPGLLLGFEDVEWEGGTGGNQTGTSLMTASLVFRLPTSTYLGNWGPHDEYEKFTEALYEVLLTHPAVGDRRMSGDGFTDEFYVAIQAFDLTLYQTRPLKTIPKPAPDIRGTMSTTLTIEQ